MLDELPDDGNTLPSPPVVSTSHGDVPAAARVAEYWMHCTKCNERRPVPRGTFLTFQTKEAKFYCHLVGGTCRLTERRRRVH